MGVDFDAPLDLALTSVLATCVAGADGRSIPVDEIAHWHMAKRRQALLAVAVATHGPLRDVTVTCNAPECGERMDLQLDLTAFRTDWRDQHVAVPDHDLVLRLPVPGDLANMAGPPEDVLGRLIVEGELPDAPNWVADVDAALSEADPLGDLELQATCPECGAPVRHPFALEPFLLAELAGEQTRLVDEIHVLAMAYHWSETEILALPASRRALYLDRIREAWAA